MCTWLYFLAVSKLRKIEKQAKDFESKKSTTNQSLTESVVESQVVSPMSAKVKLPRAKPKTKRRLVVSPSLLADSEKPSPPRTTKATKKLFMKPAATETPDVVKRPKTPTEFFSAIKYNGALAPAKNFASGSYIKGDDNCWYQVFQNGLWVRRDNGPDANDVKDIVDENDEADDREEDDSVLRPKFSKREIYRVAFFNPI